MKNNILTIIYVFYDQSKEHIIALFDSIVKKGFQNNSDVFHYFIIDNPKWKQSKRIKDLLSEINNSELFETNINLNKTQQIINSLDKINSKYIKIIDGDDEISNKLKINKLLKYLSNHTFDSVFINTEYYNSSLEKTKRKFIYSPNSNNFIFEPKIIYNTLSLKKAMKNSINLKGVNYLDDQYRLWKIAQLPNVTFKRKNYYFTKYNISSGRSSKLLKSNDYSNVIDSMLKIYETLSPERMNKRIFIQLKQRFLPRLISNYSSLPESKKNRVNKILQNINIIESKSTK